MSFLFLLFSFFFSENGGVKIEKQLLYDRHTLEDNYEYRKVERSFQWDKIAGMIDSLLNFENQAKEFGALSNYKNRNGRAPLSDSSRKDAYRAIEDKYGVKRDQSVPFYKTEGVQKGKIPPCRIGYLISVSNRDTNKSRVPNTFWTAPNDMGVMER